MSFDFSYDAAQSPAPLEIKKLRDLEDEIIYIHRAKAPQVRGQLSAHDLNDKFMSTRIRRTPLPINQLPTNRTWILYGAHHLNLLG